VVVEPSSIPVRKLYCARNAARAKDKGLSSPTYKVGLLKLENSMTLNLKSKFFNFGQNKIPN